MPTEDDLPAADLLADQHASADVRPVVIGAGPAGLTAAFQFHKYDVASTIIEADDELAMARIATELTSRGTLKTRTMAAIDVDDLIATLKAGREG